MNINLSSQHGETFLLDTVTEGVTTLDLDLRIQWANRAMSESLNIAPENLVGCYCYQVWHDRKYPCENCPVQLTIKTGEPQEGEIKTLDDRQWHIRSYPLRSPEGTLEGVVEFTLEITRRKEAEEKLKRMEWLLQPGKRSQEAPLPEYGNLLELNTSRVILDAVGEDGLNYIVKDFLDLLETSVAIYEANGDYALGIFSSQWCRFMDQASRRLCRTENNSEALSCGKWLCHESCWKTAQDCMERGVPVDIECEGGIRLYAVPIRSSGEIIGSINLGYGDPPTDLSTLNKLADKYNVDFQELVQYANAYESRPAFLIENAKRRMEASAWLIGEIVERRQAEESLRESEERYRMLFEHSPLGVLHANEKGVITACNNNFEQIIGSLQENLVGLNMLNLPDKKLVAELQKTLQGGIGFYEDVYHSTTASKSTPIRLHFAPIGAKESRVTGCVGIVEDISSQKQIERELRESYEFSYALMNNLPYPIVVISSDSSIIYVNSALENLTGFASSEVVGKKPPFPWWPAENLQQVEINFQEMFYKEIQRAEHWFLKKNGEYFCVEINATNLYKEEGEVAYYLSSWVDITERKRAEEALIQSEKYYRAIFETSGSAMCIIEGDTTISQVNTNFEKLSGYSRQEVEGKRFSSGFLSPNDLERMKEYHHWRRQDPDAAPRHYEFRFMTRHGEWRDVSFTIDVIPGTNKSIGSGIDITERKRAEEELRKREEHMQAILQATPDPLVIYDSIGHPLYMNPAFCEVFGWRLEELQDQHIPFVPEEQKELTFSKIQEIYRTGIPVKFDTKRLTKDNRLLDIRVSAAIIRTASHEHYGLVVHLTDITERKQMEQKLEEMSFHDSCTGLYNRNFFEEEMKRLSDKRHNPVGIIVCDLDGLKFVNDSQGHQAGDRVLVNIAEIMRQNFRTSDIIARIGGDEFAVLLPQTHKDAVHKKVQAIRNAVQDYNTSDPETPLSLSIGYAVSYGETVDMQALFREADNRMYREKYSA